MNTENIRPGMWITQNVVSHQNDYILLHVERIDGKFVHFDIIIRIHKLRNSGRIYPGTLVARSSAIDMHIRTLSKSMFREMKRPKSDIRRGAIQTIFGARNIN